MALASKGGGGRGGRGGGRIGVSEQQLRGVMVQGLRKWPKKDNGRGECSPERTKVWTEPPPKLKANFPASNTSSSIMSSADSSNRVVPVVYYLSRNGQLEHPHFIQVPLSSSSSSVEGGLFLRDVINRLNVLRGKGMASQYAWSSKRSYKNGYVWHDLEEDDLIHPVHGHEYVLKGSEILQQPIPSSSTSSNYDGNVATPAPPAAASSSNPAEKPYHPLQLISTAEDSDFPIIVRDGAAGSHRNDNYYNFPRRRNQSWSSTEYKVYRADHSLSHEYSSKLAPAADAATQTDDKRRRRRPVVEADEVGGDGSPKISPPHQPDRPSAVQRQQQQSTELRREEISPPPSDSSPETLESLMKADGRLILPTSVVHQQPPPLSLVAVTTTNTQQPDESTAADDESCQNPANGRVKASSVLMSLFSCGSISFRDCGAAAVKDHGFSLVSSGSSYYKPRLPRGGNKTALGKESRISNGVEDCAMGGGSSGCSSFRKMVFEEREYFSGSLLVDGVSKKDEFIPHPSSSSSAMLKRSSSYNADRSSHLKLEETELDGVRAKCIPRKPKTKHQQQQQPQPQPPPNKKKELTNSQITSLATDSSKDDNSTDAR